MIWPLLTSTLISNKPPNFLPSSQPSWSALDFSTKQGISCLKSTVPAFV